jgi:hypothetical protein
VPDKEAAAEARFRGALVEVPGSGSGFRIFLIEKFVKVWSNEQSKDSRIELRFGIINALADPPFSTSGVSGLVFCFRFRSSSRAWYWTQRGLRCW